MSASIPFLRPLFRCGSRDGTISADEDEKGHLGGPARGGGIDLQSTNRPPAYRPLELDLNAVGALDKETDIEQARAVPNWSPFITVPDSLSSQVSTVVVARH